MKTLTTAFILIASAAVTLGLPPAVEVRIDKIEGTVTEVTLPKDSFYEAVRIEMTFSSDPEKTKKLYATIRKKSRYPIQAFKRPRDKELILMFPSGKLPKGIKKGDRIRIVDYALRGSDASDSYRSAQAEGTVTLNP